MTTKRSRWVRSRYQRFPASVDVLASFRWLVIVCQFEHLAPGYSQYMVRIHHNLIIVAEETECARL